MHTYKEFLFYILFSSTATLAFASSAYLLLRRSNGFAPDIDTPVRLRRWIGVFFATAGVSQLYWLFIYYNPLRGELFDRALLCTALDSVLSTPALLCSMLVLLQDRRRPLWPIFLTMALYLIYLLTIYTLGIRDTRYVGLPLLLIFSVFSIVLLCAVRQYDRWLLDNYADLEHKEVRTSVGVLAAFIVCAIAYSLANDYFYFEIIIELTNILLITVLLWRVETLQTLEEPAVDDGENNPKGLPAGTAPITDKLKLLLQQYCVDQQYYLRHDASLTQLAKLLGTNRNYLSQHFAQHGLNYNTYINVLRIQHFERLYEEARSSQSDINVSRLYTESGFNNYSTFARAFKKIKETTFTEWLSKNNIL